MDLYFSYYIYICVYVCVIHIMYNFCNIKKCLKNLGIIFGNENWNFREFYIPFRFKLIFFLEI